jgi:HTH-type transcriptional regulator/antitoxin HipB
VQVHTVRDLGAAIREARAKDGLTQTDLARRAGVSREWLSRLENGHPRLETQLVLDTLAAAGLVLTASETPPSDTAEEAWDTVFARLTDRLADSPAARRSSDEGTAGG